MEAMENIRNGGAMERQSEGLGVGAWSHIEKVALQPIDYQTRIGPLFEVGCIAAARGLLATFGGWAALWVGSAWGAAVGAPLDAGLVGPGVGLSAFVGVGVGLYTLQAKLGEAFDVYRNREIAHEVYTRETAAAAAQSSERLTVEVIERHPAGSGAGRIVYDDLQTDGATLALAVQADSVSKAALMRAGVPERRALDLLTHIVALGYATASTGNAPGKWTAKGRALRRVLLGRALSVGDDHDGDTEGVIGNE